MHVQMFPATWKERCYTNSLVFAKITPFKKFRLSYYASNSLVILGLKERSVHQVYQRNNTRWATRDINDTKDNNFKKLYNTLTTGTFAVHKFTIAMYVIIRPVAPVTIKLYLMQYNISHSNLNVIFVSLLLFPKEHETCILHAETFEASSPRSNWHVSV